MNEWVVVSNKGKEKVNSYIAPVVLPNPKPKTNASASSGGSPVVLVMIGMQMHTQNIFNALLGKGNNLDPLMASPDLNPLGSKFTIVGEVAKKLELSISSCSSNCKKKKGKGNSPT
ncbi:unnamed protein product, partial [Ilex paraguariensis]